MRVSENKDGSAAAVIFRKGSVTKDIEVEENVIAGMDKKGQLVEIQFIFLDEFPANSKWRKFLKQAKHVTNHKDVELLVLRAALSAVVKRAG